MQGRAILTQDQLTNHVTQLAQQDIIWNPLYDSANYLAAGQPGVSFFSVPQGQGVTTVPLAAGAKTIGDTNMTAAGQLTKGNAFYMTGQELLFYPGESPESAPAAATLSDFINDTYIFSKNGTLSLTIGSNRQYLVDGPLGMFPPATRLAVAGALATVIAATYGQIAYGVMSGEVYTVVPIYIEATLGFQENLTWQVAQPMPSANIARVFSRLRGYLNRNAQ